MIKPKSAILASLCSDQLT